MHDRTAGLRAAAEHATVFLATLDERPVAARADAAAVRSSLGGPLPELGEDPATVIDALAAGAEPGLVATAGPRHFGFVIGGAAPPAPPPPRLGAGGGAKDRRPPPPPPPGAH